MPTSVFTRIAIKTCFNSENIINKIFDFTFF